jgi:hypothetical protein
MQEFPKRVSAFEQADALWKRQYQALGKGEMLPECLLDENLQCLDYYPLTLILGKAFEQIGQAGTETDARRLFLLIGHAMPYLGVRWQQSGKCRTPRLLGTPSPRGRASKPPKHSDNRALEDRKYLP